LLAMVRVALDIALVSPRRLTLDQIVTID